MNSEASRKQSPSRPTSTTRIHIPFHRGILEAEIPDTHLKAILTPHASPAGTSAPTPADERRRVAAALDHPIGSPPLETLAIGKKTATLITSDHTRPVPSHITLPLLLERLRRGNPEIAIRILVATGCHRASTPAEMREKFGAEVVEHETFIMHNAADDTQLRHIGVLPSGGALRLNAHALDTDLLIGEGFIEPHFFAGFSGGRKCVLPGVAALGTVFANHCSAFIAHPNARAGQLEGNPIHRDMRAAAERARLAFILNVTLAPDKTILGAFAGHWEQAHLAGCDTLRQTVSVPRVEGDVVITGNGGYPLDQNLYQAVKGMTAAETCCKPGGTIIMVAGCSDGYGGEAFRRALAGAESPQALLSRVLNVPQDETPPDQWEYQILARILSKHRVVLVSPLWEAKAIQAVHLEAADCLQTAVEAAIENAGPSARVVVIPDGVSVIVSRQAPGKQCCLATSVLLK